MSNEAVAHPHPNYVKIWAVLCGLLFVSVMGPMIGIPLVTLMTAFGIAVVKAYLVAKNFMHLDIGRKFVVYLLVAALALTGLFYAGTAPDVMQHHGMNWDNQAARAETARAQSQSGTHSGASKSAQPLKPRAPGAEP